MESPYERDPYKECNRLLYQLGYRYNAEDDVYCPLAFEWDNNDNRIECPVQTGLNVLFKNDVIKSKTNIVK